MFNLGFGELAVILIVLLIVVGPSRLPTLMKSAGKTIRTLRQASRDIRTSIGFDELMRDDYLQPPQRPRVVPPRTAPRTPPAEPAEGTPKPDTTATAQDTAGAPDAASTPAGTAEPRPAPKTPGETP